MRYFRVCLKLEEGQVILDCQFSLIQSNISAIISMDQNQDKYKLFLEWFQKNGGKYDKDLVQYPVYYQPGNYIGVGAKSTISRNKLVIAIPFSLIITINKVKQQLKDLYDDVYKQQDDQEEDLEFLVLTLYLTYQKQKGKESFFYHYLNLVPCPENMCDWSSAQTAETEDPYLFGLLHEQKEQIPLLFDIYRKYVLKYKNIFTAPVTMKEFLWSLNFVQTRSYGYGFPETLLAPFADLFNHNSKQTIGHYMFKTDYEKKDSQPPKIYIVKSQCLNSELMGIESRQVKKYLPNQRVQILKSYFSEHQENDLVENEAHYWEQYLNQTLLNNPLETELLESDDEEDNDSNDDEQSEEGQSFDDKIEALKFKQNPPKKYWSLQLKEYKAPTIPINREFEEECDFSWYDHNDKQTYFAISTAKRVEKGEQLFNSYGQRNNRFLMLWYGFALQNNKYNSVPFRLILDSKSNKTQVYQKYVSLDQLSQGIKLKGQKKKVDVTQYLTEQFKLKESRLCQKLIMYIRFKLLKKTQDNNRKVTFPTNLKDELQMLKIYQQIIDNLREIYKSRNLQQDRQLLKQPGLKERHIFAIIHRISNKRIIEIQWSLVRIAQKIIYDLIDKKTLKQALNSARQQERDDVLQNSVGRVFYARRLLRYIKPLSYLVE